MFFNLVSITKSAYICIVRNKGDLCLVAQVSDKIVGAVLRSAKLMRRQKRGDLRFVLAMLKINTNLERLGDFAEGIARFALNCHEPALDTAYEDRTCTYESRDLIKKRIICCGISFFSYLCALKM